MAVEEPTQAWVMEGLVRRGQVAVLRGEPKTEKTARAARLATAVSRGEAFEGRATRRTNALDLAGEESLRKWEIGAGPFLWGRTGGSAFGPLRLDQAEGLFALRWRGEFGETGLVAVDPMLAAAGGGWRRVCGRSRGRRTWR